MGPGPRGPGNVRRHRRALTIRHASMGPGPRGPGNSLSSSARNVRQRCFNGAGAARSRKYDRLASQGNDLAASMGPGPRGPGNIDPQGASNHADVASMGPGPRGPGNEMNTMHPQDSLICFNGAGAARSRKCVRYVHRGHIPGASMGPGPRGPGNTLRPIRTKCFCTCFNGAGAARSRKSGGGAGGVRAEARFNGAGAARSRKCERRSRVLE